MPAYSFPMLDSKWLDLLKANGWQFACLALVCAMVIFADKHGWLPVPLDQNFRQGTMLAGFAFAALWVATIGGTASKWFAEPIARLKRRRVIRYHAKQFREYLPYMTTEERAIFAQLIHENRKSFTGAVDGGRAATLIARGYIFQPRARGGQVVSYEDVPFAIPDHIWNVAIEHKADFPFTPDRNGADAWREDWMVR